MTKRIVSMALFLSALWAPAVLAEPVFIQIFLDEAPVKGVQIYIGNELIGSSDDAGMLETDLAPGNYRVDLVNDDVRFPVSIPVEEQAESEPYSGRHTKSCNAQEVGNAREDYNGDAGS